MTPELTAIFGSGLLMIGAGAGFLLKRMITGRHHAEDAESIEQVIRIKSLLEAEGMTLDEARSLREEYRRGSGGLAQAEAKALVAKQVEAENREAAAISLTSDGGALDGEVPFYETTMGMKVQMARELDVRETELKHLLAELEAECSPARAESLHSAQKAWVAFRNEEASFQGYLYEGGTGQPVLGLARMVEMTEERIKDVRIAIEESRL